MKSIKKIDKNKTRVIIRIIESGGDAMKNNYTYPAKIKQEEDGIFLEYVDFPGLIAFGKTEEDAIEAAQEVLALYILDAIAQKKELPKASFTEKDVIYVQIWLPYYKNMAKEVYVKKNVTIPQWLDLLAKENNVNFSACLVSGIKEELGIDKKYR